MKLHPLIFSSIAAVVLTGTLSACATGSGMAKHGAHHPPASDSSAAASAARANVHGETMDMQAMCQMHREKMANKSAQEKQAMMEKHMGNMSPEMMAKHMRMMDEKCG